MYAREFRFNNNNKKRSSLALVWIKKVPPSSGYSFTGLPERVHQHCACSALPTVTSCLDTSILVIGQDSNFFTSFLLIMLFFQSNNFNDRTRTMNILHMFLIGKNSEKVQYCTKVVHKYGTNSTKLLVN